MLSKNFNSKCSTNKKNENQYCMLLLTRCSLRAETLLVLTENIEGEIEDNVEKKKSNRGRKRELESWERKKAGNYVEMSSLPACFSPSAMQTGAICHLAQNGISGACFRDWGIEGHFLSLISWTSILSLSLSLNPCARISQPQGGSTIHHDWVKHRGSDVIRGKALPQVSILLHQWPLLHTKINYFRIIHTPPTLLHSVFQNIFIFIHIKLNMIANLIK